MLIDPSPIDSPQHGMPGQEQTPADDDADKLQSSNVDFSQFINFQEDLAAHSDGGRNDNAADNNLDASAPTSHPWAAKFGSATVFIQYPSNAAGAGAFTYGAYTYGAYTYSAYTYSAYNPHNLGAPGSHQPAPTTGGLSTLTRSQQSQTSLAPVAGGAGGGAALPFSCSQCAYTSHRQKLLNEHTRFNHIGTRCYWPGCSFVAADERGVKDHLHQAHPKPLRETSESESGPTVTYRCPWPECNRPFVGEPGASRHVRFHNYKAMKEAMEEANQA
ncbi:hypothetical protein F5Y06DRAFT_303108 [Hypoxylon sp. FL0890]|nr:hypothetical protein F5Y06DRAFT_303108 [Hypoxylon sp. FL0890]